MFINKYFVGINKKDIVLNITIAFVLFCIMFLSFKGFVEVNILPKWYAFVAGGIVCFLITLFVIKEIIISLDKIVIMTIVFIYYLLIHTCLISLEQNRIYVLSVIVFILFYLSFKQLPIGSHQSINFIILCVCFIQACFGLIQCMEVFYIYGSFNLVGSFDNPAGFSACLSTGIPFCLSVVSKKGEKHYIELFLLTIIVISIILSGSRTGVITVFAIFVVYFKDEYCSILVNRKKLILPLFLILFIIIMGVLILKIDSVLERFFIWKNSYIMILNKPIFGYGTGGFMSNYMLYQADYFQKNSNTLYSMLADNVIHPFNEYLFLTIEYGIIGLILVILILLVIIKSSRRITISHICLLSVGIFACFSYPLRYPFVLVLLAYSLANIKTKEVFSISINVLGKVVSIMLIGIISVVLVNDIRFERLWGNLVQKNKFRNKELLLNSYEKLYFEWNGDPAFLYNYGAILNRVESYEISNIILNKCTHYWNDYDVQLLLADCYLQKEKFEKAEECFVLASNMCPNRFIPLYQLVHLYDRIGQKEKAYNLAEKIIHKKVKISSFKVQRIKNEMIEYVQKGL